MNLPREVTQSPPHTRGCSGIVFIIDDSSDARESTVLLAQSAGCEAKAYSSAEDFLSAYSAQLSGCLVLDVRLPGMSGIELQRELMERKSDLPIIMVTGYGEIPLAVNAMQSGAIDFLCKPYSPQAMLDRIHQALDKNKKSHANRTYRADIEARLATLSRREREVANLLAEGRSTKEVAKILGISPKTVDNHRAKVLEKLQADNAVALRKILIS